MGKAMILTDETDIYTFFEVIDRTEAESILDVGMFLKRIGSVSRQAMDKGISSDKKLIGVDFFPEVTCPVWNMIYDAVYRPDDIFLPENQQKYELATVMQLEEHMEEKEVLPMWKWLSAHASYVMTDWKFDEVKRMTPYQTAQKIAVDEKSYWFIRL